MNVSQIDMIYESEYGLSDQEMQDTALDHDASHESHRSSISPERLEVENLVRK